MACETTETVEKLSGRYESTGGTEFFEFQESGIFIYNVRADAHPTEINSSPPYTGKYRITKSGMVKINPIPLHLGLFQITFLEGKEKLLVAHRYSGRKTMLEKIIPETSK